MKKKILLSLICSILISSGLISISWGQEVFSGKNVAVSQIGDKITSGREGVVITPLFVIRVGETFLAELEEEFWRTYFKMFAANATIYARDKKLDDEIWLATTFRRPVSQEEVSKFLENPNLFLHEKIVRAKDLPDPLNKLGREISKISFIKEYLRGGIKVYPIDDLSIEAVCALARLLDSF